MDYSVETGILACAGFGTIRLLVTAAADAGIGDAVSRYVSSSPYYSFRFGFPSVRVLLPPSSYSIIGIIIIRSTIIGSIIIPTTLVYCD